MTLSNLIPGVSEAKAIVGGVMVAGVIGFGLWGARVNHLRAEHLANIDAVVGQLKASGMVKADEAHAADSVKLLVTQLAAESGANKVTTGSLDECLASLKQKSDESDARAAAYDQSVAANKANAAQIAKDRQAIATYQAKMQGMSDRYAVEGKCPMPADLRAELEKFYAKP